MARYSRLESLGAILESGLLPSFYCPDPDLAARIIKACQKGGCRAIEFTDRGDRAYMIFAELMKRRDDLGTELVVGTGSIVDAPTAALYIGLGADFVVGPSFDPEVAALCDRRRVPYVPGCATVTEIVTAETAGSELIKLFPANTLGGPAFIRALHGPRPASRILPTGGVAATRESVQEWIGAGAAALGIGTALIPSPPPPDIDLDALTALVARMLGWIVEARAASA